MTDFGEFTSQSTPQPPWHMWGGTQNWTLRSTVASGVLNQTTVGNQIAKMAYKRPETWAFWFGGRVLSHSVQVETKAIVMSFDVITGVGRSSFDTKVNPYSGSPTPPASFCEFRWQINPGVLLNPQNRKYTTQVRSPPLDDSEGDSWVLIDRIVGEDIQVQVSLTIDSFDNAGVNFVNAEAQCFFAPLSHIRPDWFMESFLGQERGGT